MGQIRILNTVTGQVKFVEPHIANDTKLLKQYGFIKQDLEEKKDSIPVKIEEPTDFVGDVFNSEDTTTATAVFDGMAKALTTDEIKAEYEKVMGKKAGNKKPETMLKEIQEKGN